MSIRKQILSTVICLFVAWLLPLNNIKAQVQYEQADSLTYVEYTRSFEQHRNEPITSLILKTAEYFMGRPYVGGTLDKQSEEQLMVNLSQFDCFTLVENSIALSEVIKSGNLTFNHYCDILRNLRYRDNEIIDYSSRLHYTSDWIYENEKKGVFTNISKSLGGRLETKTINFMSTHVSSYPQLSKNEYLQKKIKKIENQLNKREGYYVINKQSIPGIEKKIQDGDIIVFSTTISGLDFSHVGIAYRNKKHLTFIHASSTKKEVIIEPRSLVDYCNSSSRCNGITVLRLQKESNL